MRKRKFSWVANCKYYLGRPFIWAWICLAICMFFLNVNYNLQAGYGFSSDPVYIAGYITGCFLFSFFFAVIVMFVFGLIRFIFDKPTPNTPPQNTQEPTET